MGVLEDKNQYKRRVIDETIETYLQVSGAICIEGPKWNEWTTVSDASLLKDITDQDNESMSGLSNAAYQRPDGVYVVPITALKD